MIIGISGKIGSGKDTIADIIQFLTTNYNGDYLTTNYELFKQGHYPIVYNTNWKIKKMADKLKDIVCLMLNCTRQQLEEQSFKDTLLPDEWQLWIATRNLGSNNEKNFTSLKEAEDWTKQLINSYHNYTIIKTKRTVRWLLQYIGTELFRDKIHPNIHINMLFNEYHAIPHSNMDNFPTEVIYPNWIITDLRFPNEAEAILKRGGILIRVNRLQFKTEKMGEYTVHSLPLPGFTGPKEHSSETALDNFGGFHHLIDNNGTIEQLVEKVKEILIVQKII